MLCEVLTPKSLRKKNSPENQPSQEWIGQDLCPDEIQDFGSQENRFPLGEGSRKYALCFIINFLKIVIKNSKEACRIKSWVHLRYFKSQVLTGSGFEFERPSI